MIEHTKKPAGPQDDRGPGVAALCRGKRKMMDFKDNDQLKAKTALQMESAKIEFKVI